MARGYLSGSGWKEYRETGRICGIVLPPGLRESDRLPAPIFTPATKAASGHDINIDEAEATKRLKDAALFARLRDTTLELYRQAAAHAERCGILLADTKFEFGFDGQTLLLIDEALTPDSSRFWPADQYSPGGPQPSFDKQFVRDYLEAIEWNKQPPAPALPDDVVARTRAKYIDAFERLTGHHLSCRGALRAPMNGRQDEGRGTSLRELLGRLIDQMIAGGITFEDGRREFERRFISRVLDETDGHLSKAAAQLGLHRNTLARKLTELDIKPRKPRKR